MTNVKYQFFPFSRRALPPCWHEKRVSFPPREASASPIRTFGRLPASSLVAAILVLPKSGKKDLATINQPLKMASIFKMPDLFSAPGPGPTNSRPNSGKRARSPFPKIPDQRSRGRRGRPRHRPRRDPGERLSGPREDVSVRTVARTRTPLRCPSRRGKKRTTTTRFFPSPPEVVGSG